MDEENKGSNPLFEFGEVSYTYPGAEFFYKRGLGLLDQMKIQATKPVSVEQAFLLHSKQMFLRMKEVQEEIVSRIKDWKSADIGDITEVFEGIVEENSYMFESDKERALAVERTTELMLLRNPSNVQLAIIKKDRERESENDFTYLVLYPPDPNTGERIREASYPTAMCHLVDAHALLGESREMTVDEYNYKISLDEMEPLSDEELKTVVQTTGRTTLDVWVQRGLGLIDKIMKRRGEHIDPISALKNRKYAVQYAVATHRGVGLVDNDRVQLPPVHIS